MEQIYQMVDVKKLYGEAFNKMKLKFPWSQRNVDSSPVFSHFPHVSLNQTIVCQKTDLRHNTYFVSLYSCLTKSCDKLPTIAISVYSKPAIV